jgi:hypothetical protein
MRIVLLFHHSLIIRFYPLDSTLSLLMDTGTHTSPSGALRASGSPMDTQGMVTFAGVGVFSRGYLIFPNQVDLHFLPRILSCILLSTTQNRITSTGSNTGYFHEWTSKP